MLVPLTLSVARTLARGRIGVDAIALFSMAGALALGEYLAGAVVALMLAGGNALEAIADRRAREFGELIRGVETYNDTNAPGGTVQLSSMYNNAWRLNDGSYVLTNDSSFQPYRDLGVDGQ